MGAPESRRPSSSRSGRHARSESPEERAERLRRIQQMIADGTYETPERWDTALDRMFASIAK
jgi:hypothetical protein